MLLACLVFVKEVIGFDFSDLNPLVKGQAAAPEASAVRNAYFTEEVLHQLFAAIFSRYLLFSSSEEEAWEENPEQFALEEVGEGWQYEVKVRLSAFAL